MKIILNLFIWNCIIFLNISYIYCQDTVFVQKISKNYAYYVELHKGGNYNGYYHELKNIFYIDKFDTLIIQLKDIKRDKILPFDVSDSAVVEGVYPLGVPRNIMRIQVSKNGSIIFCPSFVPNYQNYVNRFIVTPCADMIGNNEIKSEVQVNKVISSLYNSARRKMRSPIIIFELCIYWTY